ncbi:hypothetical protein [Paraclostridium bifermentans]|uniref:hypothetical protein n=1 Tax=Paraclostridium bifermentans TaxID=1490 RepID=UPI0025B1DA5E|nr:hypothetical protein [Paraclostridium bifermentans]
MVIIFAFFMFNRSNTIKNNIADVEELSNVSTNLQDSEDIYTIENLYKNAKLTLTTQSETLNLVRTKDKNIYTKTKYQIMSYIQGNGRGGLYLGRGYILDDGTFYQGFFKDGNTIYAKGKFTESEMKVIEDIYQRTIEKKS